MMERLFKRMVEAEDFLDDEESLAAYSYDASGFEARPRLVLRPRNEEQLRRIIVHAKQYNLVLVPRGAGLSCRAGAIREGGVIIDMGHFTRVGRLDTQRATVDVGAGLSVAALNRALQKHDLRFPLVPENAQETLGGLAATNRVTELSASYGDYFDLVEEVDCFDGAGRFQTLKGEEVAKVVGKEGATGIITRLRLRLTKERVRSLDAIPVASGREAIERAGEVKGCLLEYCDPLVSRLLGLGVGAHLLVGYKSTEGEYQDPQTVLGLLDRRRTLAHQLWGEGFLQVEEATLEREQLLPFLDYCRKEGLPCYGHLAVGILMAQLPAGFSRARFWSAVVALGAVPGGKYGYGRAKREFLPHALRKEVLRLKEERDYQGILNKGVFL